jgi:hypothetical protein
MAVLSPVHQVRAFGKENVSKGRMAGITGAGEQNIVPVYLAREEHAVSVKGDTRIFKAGKILKILGHAHVQRGPMKITAPNHVISVVNLYDSRIIGITGLVVLSVGVLPMDFLILDIPMQGVLAMPNV